MINPVISTSPELLVIGKHVAIDFGSGKVHDHDNVLQLTEKPNVVELVFNPDVTATIYSGLPSRASSQLSLTPIDTLFGSPVLGEVIENSHTYTTKLNNTILDATYSLWIEITNRNGDPIDPTTAQPAVNADGTPQRFFIPEHTLAEIKPINGYALPITSQPQNAS